MVREQMKTAGTEALQESQIAAVWGLLEILEGYVPKLMHKGTKGSQVLSFCDEHKKLWNEFYEFNRKEKLISDGEFFGNIQENANYGIGKDGAFYGVELLHFLGNCYKKIYLLNR